MRFVCEDTRTAEAIFVETLNYSKGSLGIVYDGESLSAGNRVSTHIENLNVFQKVAEVV